MLPFEINFVNLILFFSLILYVLYKYFTKHFTYWRDQGMPYKKPLLVFGSYKNMMLLRENVGQVYKTIYEEFLNEGFVGCFRSRRPELLIKDPDFIKLVLVKDFPNFQERQIDTSEKISKLFANLFATRGEKWKAMRQKFTPIFTSGKLRNMFHLIVETGEKFQTYLDNTIKDQSEHEIKNLVAKFATDVIGSVGFGIKMNAMEDSNAPFRIFGGKIFEASKVRTLKALLLLLYPKLFEFLNIKIMDPEAEDFFVSTVSEIVKEREKSKVRRDDFIDLMLDLKAMGHTKNSTDETRIEFTDIFMTAQAFIFFAAGFETSSTAMSFTLYELAKNPDVKERVLSEIDTVLAKHGGKISYEGVSEMKYLKCVFSETIRKYPALGVLTRVSETDYTFPGTKYSIKKGYSVIIPVMAMHYDPQYYPDPEKFDPDRFTPEACQKRHPMVYLPFGEGPRNCIGMRYGMMQSLVGLVSFLDKFTVEPSERTEEKIVLDSLAFVTSPKNGIWLKISNRNKTT